MCAAAILVSATPPAMRQPSNSTLTLSGPSRTWGRDRRPRFLWSIIRTLFRNQTGGGNKTFTFHWFEVNIDDMGEPGKSNAGAPNSETCPGRGFGEKSAGPFVPDPVLQPNTTVNLPDAPLGNCDCPDFYRITIYKGVLSNEVTFLPNGKIDPNSLDRTTVIYESFGYIDGGNLQIHPPTGFDQ